MKLIILLGIFSTQKDYIKTQIKCYRNRKINKKTLSKQIYENAETKHHKYHNHPQTKRKKIRKNGKQNHYIFSYENNQHPQERHTNRVSCYKPRIKISNPRSILEPEATFQTTPHKKEKKNKNYTKK